MIFPKNPVHPGEILLEDFLRPLKITQARLAAHLGLTPAHVNEIVVGNPVATGDGGYQIHREQRCPGAHPVAREQSFASTGSAFGRGGWASWSPPASLERRVFPLGTALPARVSQPFGAVQCRFEHKPAADLPGRGERATAHVLDGDFESGNSKNAVEYRVAVSSPNIGPNVRITDRNRFSTRNLDADETSTSTANGSSTRCAWRAARRVRRLLQHGRDGGPIRACGPPPSSSTPTAYSPSTRCAWRAARRPADFYPLVHTVSSSSHALLHLRAGVPRLRPCTTTSSSSRRSSATPRANQRSALSSWFRTGRHRESQRRDKAAAPASAAAGRSGGRAGLPARRATGVVQNA